MIRNIAAWTGTGTTMENLEVPYISINREDESSDTVSITVRERGNPSFNKQARIIMCREEFALLLVEALRNI